MPYLLEKQWLGGDQNIFGIVTTVDIMWRNASIILTKLQGLCSYGDMKTCKVPDNFASICSI